MTKRKIMIVDDDKDFTAALEFRLVQSGYKVYCAYDGFEALGMIRCVEPDVIILDVMLPRKNGYEISRFIKQDIMKGVYAKEMAIIILTARTVSDEDREEFLITWSQADRHYYKPVDYEELLASVEELVSNQVQEEKETES